MAKKKKGDDEAEEESGGGAKGKIIKIVVGLLVGAFVAKTFFLKPPPPTEEALKAKAKGTYVDMAYKCATWNEIPYDATTVEAEFEKMWAEEHAAAPTTVAPATTAPAAPATTVEGQSLGLPGHGGLGLKLASARRASAEGGAEPVGPPVLEVDATQVNLDPEGSPNGHYLKVGVGLELAEGSDPEAQKTHGTGAFALHELIDMLTGKKMEEVSSQETRDAILHQIGYDTCKFANGGVVKAYYTNFVFQ